MTQVGWLGRSCLSHTKANVLKKPVEPTEKWSCMAFFYCVLAPSNASLVLHANGLHLILGKNITQFLFYSQNFF